MVLSATAAAKAARKKFFEEEESVMGTTFQASLPASMPLMAGLADTSTDTKLKLSTWRKQVFGVPLTVSKAPDANDQPHWLRPLSSTKCNDNMTTAIHEHG